LRFGFARLVLLLFLTPMFPARLAGADGAVSPMPPSVEQLARAVLLVNLRVKAARTQWNSALRQIKRNLVPADPAFTYLRATNQRPAQETAGERTVGGQISR
jgi:hypothetical protein